MNYYEFERLVVDNILDYLPESFADAKVSVQDVCKLGSKYKGLTIIKPGEFSSPVADLDALYEEYLYTGSDKDFVLAEIADLFKKPLPHFAIDEYQDFEAVKDKLYIRISGANNEALINVPHRIIEGTDLVITYHVDVTVKTDGEKAAFIVTNALVKEYDVDEEKLYVEAMKSAPKINPPYISTLATELGLPEGFPPIYLITSRDKVYGAAVIMYPGMLDELFLKVNGPYFILPSSVHEVLVIPDDGKQDPKHLKWMVETINRDEVSASEQLSNNIYHYNGKTISTKF